jgi:hypothetical protein
MQPQYVTRPLFLGLILLSPTAVGCFSPWFRANSDPETRRNEIRGKLESEERPRIISQIGAERQLTLGRLENVGLVSTLPGTGGIVKASQPREKMLDLMRREEVDQPNSFIDADSTAMVIAFVSVPPAARKGNILDVVVKLSSHGEATDLQSGWLMETELMEMMAQSGQVREGFAYALAQGPVVTRTQVTGSLHPDDKLTGVVVGGGRLLKARELAIGINNEFSDALTMAAVVPAINARFTVFDGRKQVGIATPSDDSNINLVVPSKYELDPFHFINLVLNVSFNESSTQKLERIALLQKQLNDPITVRNACWQLEALGEEGIPILAERLNHPNPEIRFYVAHSMAYLDDERSIEPLVELCHQEPAFRAMCLNALAVLDNYKATDALESLFHVADAETRYGALRALRHRDRDDPRVTNQKIGDVGGILEVPSAGPPLVAVSLHETPEVAIFGNNPMLMLPGFHYVNPRIIIQPAANNQLTISHFQAGKDDRIVQVPTDLRSVLSGIAEVGGSYGDWVSFLRECSEKGYLAEPFAMNPIPSAGRTYNRENVSTREPSEHLYEDTVMNAIDVPNKSNKSVWYNPFSW